MIESIYNAALTVWSTVGEFSVKFITANPFTAGSLGTGGNAFALGGFRGVVQGAYNTLLDIAVPIAVVFFLLALFKIVISTPPNQQIYAFVGSAVKFGILFGGTGLGKTHLTTAMAARIIDRGYEVVYESSGGIFREFEKERFEKGEGAFTERFYDAELLIIDDLGTEMVNQFTVSTLYDLINTRMIKGRPTVISTNLTSEDMRKKYTDRIVSRLFGEYTVLLFVGKDVRMQKIQKGIR